MNGSTVAACPFGDDVSDDAAVVVGGEHEVGARGTGGVEAVHPCVAEIDDVDQVAEAPFLDYRGVDADLHRTHRAGCLENGPSPSWAR